MFHVMDSQSHYSTERVCYEVRMESAVRAFEANILSQFLPPISVQGDNAFKNAEKRGMV